MDSKFFLFLSIALLSAGCEILDEHPDTGNDGISSGELYLDDVADLFSRLPLSSDQMTEVRDAVRASSGNGYDEEYTMKDLFSLPGKGVGDPETKAPSRYSVPLRDMIREYVSTAPQSKLSADNGRDIRFDESFLERLTLSDLQIYWPWSENWDGETLPVITFDPENDASANMGYKMMSTGQGIAVEEVVVDERMAQERPVWVINRNSDAAYLTAEVIRREHPDWEEGGSIIIRPSKSPSSRSASSGTEKRSRSLILRDFTMLRNYDCWMAGGSEFFCKIGSLEDFTAATEAEMKLYSPYVTDMLVVVKRSQVGVPIPLNTVMVSDYSPQMTHCAMMVNEDDGGSRTSWKCVAFVRIASKSYGIEMSIPINEWDDIVWRGQLDQAYLMAHNNVAGRFGDVKMTFGIEEL